MITLCYLGMLINFALKAVVSLLILLITCYFMIAKVCRRTRIQSVSNIQGDIIATSAIMSNMDRLDKSGKDTDTVTVNADDKTEGLIGENRKPRLDYLDNIKSILTVIVLFHNIIQQFSGGFWYFSIGNYYNTFKLVGSIINGLNECYFMCLFFFISGYFTPTSCDKKGTFIYKNTWNKYYTY